MRRLMGRKWLVRALLALATLGGVAAVKSEARPCFWWRESYYAAPSSRVKVGECGITCNGGPYCWGTSTDYAVYVEGDCGNCPPE
jgi:hypothetical protein